MYICLRFLASLSPAVGLVVKIEAYGISVTLFDIFDSNSRHVEGRRIAPANLDSKRRWEILRERCDVYPCVPWKHGKLCRSGVAVFRLIPPIDTDAETTTEMRIRVSQRWRNCCFIPCASHTASKPRQIVYLEIDGKSHA